MWVHHRSSPFLLRWMVKVLTSSLLRRTRADLYTLLSAAILFCFFLSCSIHPFIKYFRAHDTSFQGLEYSFCSYFIWNYFILYECINEAITMLSQVFEPRFFFGSACILNYIFKFYVNWSHKKINSYAVQFTAQKRYYLAQPRLQCGSHGRLE